MLSTTMCTFRARLQNLLRRVQTACSQRPLRDESHPQASPAPGPSSMGEHTPALATAPSPAPEPLFEAGPDDIKEPSPALIPETIPEPTDDVVPDPAESLSAATIPLPSRPRPICQFPSEVGYQWMVSHEFVVAAHGPGLRCTRCGLTWPAPAPRPAREIN